VRPLSKTRTELALGTPWRSPETRPPRSGEDRFADIPDAELLKAIEERYGAADRESGSSSLQRRIEQALRKRRKTLDRKLEKLEAELERAQTAIACEREGELLKSVLSSAKRGDTEVVARDHERGEDVTIALDPTKSPSENLELIFKRYRKGVRTLTKGGAQEDAVRADLREIAAAQDAYLELSEREGGVSDEDLEAFAQRPLVSRLLSRYAPTPRVSKSGGATNRSGGPAPDRKFAGRMVPARLMPRRYETAGGLEIWVGRSDAANDFLSTRLARGKDLFFHLDGAPGSHVILRTGGRADPPSDAILDACELAVHFSKAKKATRADVHIVPIANVKKPKGAKPGLVMVHGGRSLHLRRIPVRLERVLNARIEDE
jgi:predicted ribosome quality control (RQC) complex YloA/Tae2 family protein